MLRGLAFRLRPGAQGVVLVKPQFELPDRQVQGGQRRRSEPAARGAREGDGERAEALGFALAGTATRPSRAAAAPIEILAHLRFAGRPARLPPPGETAARREAGAAAARAAPEPLRWFAVVAPGLEEAAEREIAALPERPTSAPRRRRRVERAGRRGLSREPLAALGDARARRAWATVEAREFGKLRRGVAAPRWERLRRRRARDRGARERHAAAASITRARSPRPRAAGDRRRRRRERARPADGRDAPTCRSWCAASRIASCSASTPRASGCTGAARASRSARRRCARRWPPGCWRWATGNRASPLRRSDVRRGHDPDRGGAAGASIGARDRPGVRGRIRDRGLAALLARPARRHEAAALRDEARARVRAAAPAPIAGSDRDAERDRERAPQRRARRGRRAHDHRVPRPRRRAPARRHARAGDRQPALRPPPRQPARGRGRLSRARPRAARALPRLARRVVVPRALHAPPARSACAFAGALPLRNGGLRVDALRLARSLEARQLRADASAARAPLGRPRSSRSAPAAPSTCGRRSPASPGRRPERRWGSRPA